MLLIRVSFVTDVNEALAGTLHKILPKKGKQFPEWLHNATV